MAEGLNRATLLGTIGQDPGLRVLDNGNAILRIRMVTNEKIRVNNEPKELTEWHSVVVWGRRAEGLAKILKKGDKILVEGRLTTRSWEDQGGQRRYKTEITASNVVLGLGGGARGRGEGSQGSHSSGPGESGDDQDYGASPLSDGGGGGSFWD